MAVFPITVFVTCFWIVSSSDYKVGILVDDVHWSTSGDVPSELITSGTTEVNFTTHTFTGGYGLPASKAVCKLLAEGYSGFISFVDCPTASILDLQAKSRHVPHVTFTKTLCNDKTTEASFRFLPSCNIVNDALRDIVATQPTLVVTILHDSIMSNECLQSLIVKLSKIPVSSRVLNVQSVLRTDLVSKYDMKNFILIARPEIVNRTLIEAEALGLLSQNCSWVIYTNELSLQLNITDINHGRVVFVRSYFPGMTTEIGTCASIWPETTSVLGAFIHDGQNVFVKGLASLESVHGSVSGNVNCRNLSSVLTYGNDLKNEMAKVSFTGNTGVVQWSSDLSRHISTYQICSVENNKTTLQYMGYWQNKHLLQLKNNLFANDFSDFGNATLTIATKPIKPFVIFTENNGTIEYSGFCFDILNELARHFKFKYTIVEPPDGMYGGLNSDGTWNGMVGMVKRGDVDFAIGPFTITSIRETVIDFTVPFIEDGVGILTKRPDEEPNKIFKMFKPFSLQVWCFIGVAIVSVGILLCLIGYFNPYVKKSTESPQSSPEHHLNQRSLKETTWLIYGSFLEQGIDPRPTTFSGRSMLGFWWVFTILMTSTYTANLAAVLTVSIPDQPINSLTELVAQDEITPLVKSGTNLHTLFMTSKSGIYRQVWEMMSGMPKVTSNADALKIVKKGKYAFMTDMTQLEYIVRQECEAYLLADEIFNNAGLGFVLPENANFKDAFNLNIMKMQEAGMTERWKEEWWPTIDSCSLTTRTGGAQSLGMDSLAGLFYVYIGIAGLSILAFICSLIYTKTIATKIHPFILSFRTAVFSRSPTQITLLSNK